MEKEDLYRMAIDKWGMELQLVMLMEECAELIKATSKKLRRQSWDVNDEVWDSMAEEIADVEIMIEQFRTVVNPLMLEEKVKQFKAHKLHRLSKMLGVKEWH